MEKISRPDWCIVWCWLRSCDCFLLNVSLWIGNVLLKTICCSGTNSEQIHQNVRQPHFIFLNCWYRLLVNFSTPPISECISDIYIFYITLAIFNATVMLGCPKIVLSRTSVAGKANVSNPCCPSKVVCGNYAHNVEYSIARHMLKQ